MNVTDKITVTLEDNMELMKRYPDSFFDLAIVDPPYGINAPNMKMGESKGYKSTASKTKGRLNSGGGKLKNRILNKSNISWDDEIPPPEYFKELFRVSKNQIIWGGNYFDLPPTRGIIFWDKLQPWENFSQFELGWTSFDVPAAKIAITTRGGQMLNQKFTQLKSRLNYINGHLINTQKKVIKFLIHILVLEILELLAMIMVLNLWHVKKQNNITMIQ